MYLTLKMFSFLRIFKMLRYKQQFLRVFQQSSSTRMTGILSACLLLVHEVACFWFLMARIEDFSPDTLVARNGFADQSIMLNYAWSCYWALQTLVTVGYGDFPAITIAEIIICIAWMYVGVFFYSFLVGAIQSQVSQELKNTDTLAYKLKQLDEFRDRSGMDPELYFNITVFMQNNYYLLYGKQDEDKLQSLLAPDLLNELMFH